MGLYFKTDMIIFIKSDDPGIVMKNRNAPFFIQFQCGRGNGGLKKAADDLRPFHFCLHGNGSYPRKVL